MRMSVRYGRTENIVCFLLADVPFKSSGYSGV